MPHPLRRVDREITDSREIDRLLSEARFATVALADGDEPYIVTLSCGFDAGARRLLFHVAPAGRKLDVIARNPRACVTTVADLGYKTGECAHPFRSVVMSGRMRVLSDLAEVRSAMRILIAQLEPAEENDATYRRNNLDDDAALARFRMLEFAIEETCAKEGE